MAASFSSQLSLLLGPYRNSGNGSSSGLAPFSLIVGSFNNHRRVLVGRYPLRDSGAVTIQQGSESRRRRLQHIVGARRPGKDRNGGVAEAVEKATTPDDSESVIMYNGKKLYGLEPDFWEGEKWDTFGFLMQYLWAFGILISLVACGVAVTSYNSGARDIRDTDVFKEALENQVEADSSLESDITQDFPEASEAPPLE